METRPKSPGEIRALWPWLCCLLRFICQGYVVMASVTGDCARIQHTANIEWHLTERERYDCGKVMLSFNQTYSICWQLGLPWACASGNRLALFFCSWYKRVTLKCIVVLGWVSGRHPVVLLISDGWRRCFRNWWISVWWLISQTFFPHLVALLRYLGGASFVGRMLD